MRKIKVLFLLLLFCFVLTSFSYAAKIVVEGNYGYDWGEPGEIIIKADTIRNLSKTKSGPIYLQIWATKNPYYGGTIKGTKIGEIMLSWLRPGYVHNNIYEYTYLNRPAKGSYYVYFVIAEQNKNGVIQTSTYKGFPKKQKF